MKPNLPAHSHAPVLPLLLLSFAFSSLTSSLSGAAGSSDPVRRLHERLTPPAQASASDGSWGEWAPASPAPGPRSGHSAIYDPVRDRMVVFGGPVNDAWALSLAGAPAWVELAPTGVLPGTHSYHSAIYDPVRDRMVVFGGCCDGAEYSNRVWALSLAGAPVWTELVPAGTPPVGRIGHTAIYDPVRDQLVVFGGRGYASEPGDHYFNDAWALSLSGTPTWTALTPTGAPPEARSDHGAIYDPVGDRMVVFGGRGGSSSVFNDFWALSLAGTPAWAQIPAGPPPVEHDGHSAICDPVRQRMVVFGGIVEGVAYSSDVLELTLTGTPAQAGLAPAGTPPSGREHHSAMFDPNRDRMVIFGGSSDGGDLADVWALTWGTPAPAGVTCPEDVVWTPGASLPLTYGITNPYGFSQVADYTLASTRDWPGLPISGSAAAGPGSTLMVPISVPVPDSAADGRNPLTFRVTLRSVPQSALCSHDVGDASTPVLLSLVSAQADPDRVRLTWYAAAPAGLELTVYRRMEGEAFWSALGRVSPDGTGRIAYEDLQVASGVRYGYRLGLPSEGGEVFAGETWLDVPVTPRFAFAGVHPNPVSQEIAVEFSLPDASPARLEVFDLAGRRVLAREVGALGGGSHVLRLEEGRSLASGVYQLRLSRGTRTVTIRAVIVR